MYKNKTWLELKNICKELNISHIGTKQEILERLEQYNNSKECSICLDKINDNNHTLPCNHCLHNNCFEELRKNSNKCPLCRKEFEPPKIETFDEIDIFNFILDTDLDFLIEMTIFTTLFN